MMEQAGRGLAREALDLHQDGAIVVLAGAGGNGGGGLACARHLANRERPVTVVLDRRPSDLEGVVAGQRELLERMDVPIRTDVSAVEGPSLVVDALVGYGLEGPLRDSARELAQWVEETETEVLSLDVPSGIDATTGHARGDAIRPPFTKRSKSRTCRRSAASSPSESMQRGRRPVGAESTRWRLLPRTIIGRQTGCRTDFRLASR